ASALRRRSVRRVRSEKRQNRLIELARPYLGEGVAAAREYLDFRGRDQPGELLGKIRWRDDVVLGADHQGRRFDPSHAFGSAEGEDRIDPAGGDLGRREQRQALRLKLAQPLVVAGNEPTRIEEQRAGLHMGAGTERKNNVLP